MRLALEKPEFVNLASRPLAAGVALLLGAEAILLLLGLLIPMRGLLRGWLVGFAIWSTIPIGSMTLLLIHRLTGGEWGVAAAPVLRPAAAMTAVAALAFLPILVALPEIYPWAADPSVVPADVARWYLNAPSFWIRAVAALGGWSFLGIVFAAGMGSRLQAGLGLAFFGLTISLVAVDWYLSVEPHYEATAFAAMIAIQQLLAALALLAVMAPPDLKDQVAGDVGGLMIAALLGVVYLEYMTFAIAWYGNLAEKADWFLKRGTTGWIIILVLAITIGAAIPFAMLLKRANRFSRRALRLAGTLILFGSALHISWLLVPAFDDQTGVIAGACASLVVLAAVSLLIGPALASLAEARHAE
ncbi:hypothetical protein [Bradyrhizobium genosp. P]|uniref:hypothetical protein n=1 Tax=Bradyrhizobium genosp. P TaxID=83641 RepID=UPI003CF4084B